MTPTCSATSDSGPQARWIHRSDLTSLAGVLTSDYRCTDTSPIGSGAPLHGIIQQHEVQPGLFIRLNRLRDRHGVTPTARLHPGLKISLVWRGAAQVSFGEHTFELDASRGASGLMVAVDTPIEFVRHGKRGGLEYSVVISLTPDWLQRRLGSACPSHILAGTPGHQQSPHPGHLQGERWNPSTSLIARLEALSQRQEMTTSLALERESVALAMVAEALSHLGQTSPADSPQPWQQRLEGWVSSGESSHLTLGEMASRLGISLRQLQRRYRQAYGVPLATGLRQRHLERARQALEDGVSVETAADIAGYQHAANFATAFKQRYAEPPAAYRRRHSQRHEKS